MPTYDYIKNDSQELKSHLLMSERNDFLLNLNGGIDKLSQRTRFSIILGDTQPTVNSIPVIESDDSDLWIDGKPDPIDPQKNDANGDGEVLISSGDALSDFRDVLQSDHRKIVTDAEPIVAARLNESLSQTFEAPIVEDEIGIWTDAPGDIEITAPDGKQISNDKNEITDAKIASESKSDGFKIVSVPNPKKGRYVVKVKNSSSNRKYHVGTEFSDYSGKSQDKSSIIEASTDEGTSEEYVIDVDQNNDETVVEDIVEKDVIKPEIKLDPEFEIKTEYSTEDKILIKVQVSDNVSEIQKISIKGFFDEKEFDIAREIDLSKEDLGEHQIKLTAQDEEGNIAEKIINIIIKDKTGPEIVVYGDLDGKEFLPSEKILLDYSVLDNKSKAEKISKSIFFDGEEIFKNEIDLLVKAAGEHQIKIVATDENGNVSEKIMKFQIKPTFISSQTKNVFAQIKKKKHHHKGKHHKKHKSKHKKTIISKIESKITSKCANSNSFACKAAKVSFKTTNSTISKISLVKQKIVSVFNPSWNPFKKKN